MRVSAFPGSLNSEATVADDDDAVVDAIVEERDCCRPRRTRVRRKENARLTSAGASVSVSADERGDSSAVMGAGAGGRGTASDCGVWFLQRGNGMERPRGDDGADTGTGVGTLDTGSSNGTFWTGSGLGTDSVFLWTPAVRGGARGCTRRRPSRFSVISGGPLRTEGTSHVTESTATLYS